MAQLVWKLYDAICWQAGRIAIRLGNRRPAMPWSYWAWHLGTYRWLTSMRGPLKQWARRAAGGNNAHED